MLMPVAGCLYVYGIALNGKGGGDKFDAGTIVYSRYGLGWGPGVSKAKSPGEREGENDEYMEEVKPEWNW